MSRRAARDEIPYLPSARAPLFIDRCFVALLQCSIANLLVRGKTPRFPEKPFVRRGK
jgi:hypothetical protein